MNGKIYEIKDTVYLQVINLITDCDWKTANKLTRKKYKCDFDIFENAGEGLYNYIDMENGSMVHNIWLPRKADFDTIAHEAFHCTIRVMRHVGGSLDDSSEELVAHYLGFLIREILRIIKK